MGGKRMWRRRWGEEELGDRWVGRVGSRHGGGKVVVEEEKEEEDGRG